MYSKFADTYAAFSMPSLDALFKAESNLDNKQKAFSKDEFREAMAQSFKRGVYNPQTHKLEIAPVNADVKDSVINACADAAFYRINEYNSDGDDQHIAPEEYRAFYKDCREAAKIIGFKLDKSFDLSSGFYYFEKNTED